MRRGEFCTAAGAAWRLLVLVALACGCLQTVSSFIKVGSPSELESLFKFGPAREGQEESSGDKLDLVDLFLQDVVPTWLGQAPSNENGTAAQYKKYNMLDESNDDAFQLTAQQLITRSGFRYELYDAVAEDGYVTQITHLINPLADDSELRQPPVLLEHGGQIDITAYLVASSIQHFPERWPRSGSEEPVRSWNRSLAFYLANEGFDVWLAETRGSSDSNQRHQTKRLAKSYLAQWGAMHTGDSKATPSAASETPVEQLKRLAQQWDYWAFTQDDIVAYEYKSHIDTVRRMSGSDKLHIITYSLSTPISLAFFSQRPDYAAKVAGFVSLAPIVSSVGVSAPVKLVFNTLCPLMPDELGTLMITHTLFTQTFRDLLRFLAANKSLRYSLLKGVLSILLGPSQKWRTLLDLNVLGHLLRKVSFREVKQLCQQMRANRLQKYDYGPLKNQLVYGSWEPPLYNLSNLHLNNWLVVSGENDALSGPGSVRHLIELAQPKPAAHILVPGFNHADLFAGWQNDIFVNEPIKRYLERMSFDPNSRQGAASRGRSLDLANLFADFLPTKVIHNSQSDPAADPFAVDAFAKGLKEFFELLTKDMDKLFLDAGKKKAQVPAQPKNPVKALAKGVKKAAGAVAATATAAVAGAAVADALAPQGGQPADPLSELPLVGSVLTSGLGSLLGIPATTQEPLLKKPKNPIKALAKDVKKAAGAMAATVTAAAAAGAVADALAPKAPEEQQQQQPQGPLGEVLGGVGGLLGVTVTPEAVTIKNPMNTLTKGVKKAAGAVAATATAAAATAAVANALGPKGPGEQHKSPLGEALGGLLGVPPEPVSETVTPKNPIRALAKGVKKAMGTVAATATAAAATAAVADAFAPKEPDQQPKGPLGGLGELFGGAQNDGPAKGFDSPVAAVTEALGGMLGAFT